MARPDWLQQSIQQKSFLYLSGYLMCVVLVMLMTSWLLELRDSVTPWVFWGIVPLNALLSMLACFVAFRERLQRIDLYLLLIFFSSLLLSGFVYLSGGHTNPLISLLLVPVALSAVQLGWQATLIMSATVLFCYTFLTRYYIVLGEGGEHNHHQFMQFHLIGMWFTFALSVVLVLGLVLPLAQAARRQQSLIAQQRERMLQDEKLVTLATFAANAAHKLGTPLSTLAVLAEDLKEDLQDHPQWQEETELMQQQITVCKNTLHDLMRRADKLRSDTREPVFVPDMISQLREQFTLLYPQRSVHVRTESDSNALSVMADDTLNQALLNLLDNAAKACEDDPVMQVRKVNGNLNIRIFDHGPGIPDSIREHVGKPFITSRQDGLGLGLYLSHATLNRLGGTLKIQEAESGTVMEVVLPLFSESGVGFDFL